MAFLGGLFLAFLNLLGASAIFFVNSVSSRRINMMLAFAAGVMLSASFTSLIIPGANAGGILPVIVGIALGAIVIGGGDHMLARFGVHSYELTHTRSKRRLHGVLLFVAAITLHNLPEGLAVGVGFGSGDISRALVLMIAIGLQNIPEGLAVGFSLLSTEHYSKRRSYALAVISGLVEVPLSLIGALSVSLFKPILPYAMGFAAGAMIFVISHEIIPETQRERQDKWITITLILGLVMMLFLDIFLS